MMRRATLVLGAVCMLHVLSSQTAQAQTWDGSVTTSLSVSYADLDLNSPAGSAVLLGRLQTAADQVCGAPARDRSMRTRRESRACAREAMRQAVAAIESPGLEAAYASWTRGATAAAGPAIQVAADGARARVSYADLNLNTERGRTLLERRVAQATTALCGDGRWTFRRTVAQRRCTEEAMEGARVQIAELVGERQLAAAAAPAAQPAAPPQVAPMQQAAIPTVAPTAAGGSFGICDTRTHTARFNGQSAALSQEERREIAFAVDGASVCSLEAAVIRAQRGNATATRRAAALRSALIARGVPAQLVTVEYTDDQSALGASVQMTFSGVAHAAPAVQNPPAV